MEVERGVRGETALLATQFAVTEEEEEKQEGV